MSTQTVVEKIRVIAENVARGNNLELVQVQSVGSNKNLTIRVFIDKTDGVTHEDCSRVSREIDNILESADFIPNSYLLEVSSPGLERELYSLVDFKRFVGNLAKVKMTTALAGQKNFRGRIAGVEDDEIVFDDKTNGLVRFTFEAVAKANLEVDLEKELKGI